MSVGCIVFMQIGLVYFLYISKRMRCDKALSTMVRSYLWYFSIIYNTAATPSLASRYYPQVLSIANHAGNGKQKANSSPSPSPRGCRGRQDLAQTKTCIALIVRIWPTPSCSSSSSFSSSSSSLWVDEADPNSVLLWQVLLFSFLFVGLATYHHKRFFLINWIFWASFDFEGG